MLFHNFPKELIHYILLLEGSLKHRNGKWMIQLRTSEEIRQRISECIAQKHFFYTDGSKDFTFWFIKLPNSKKSINTFIYTDGIIHMRMHINDGKDVIQELL